MRIAKVIHKYKIKEQPKDCAYWQLRSHAERLRTLEEIRSEYNTFDLYFAATRCARHAQTLHGRRGRTKRAIASR